MDEESTGTSLLVNDIHLTRYHVKEKEAVSVPDTVAVRDTSRLERKERVVGRSQIQPVRKIENRK